MGGDQVAAFEDVAGGLLAELGYDVERSPGMLSSLRSRLSR